MSRHPITAPADMKVSEALYRLCKHQVHNLPVVDDEGRFLGLFGLHGLLHALLPKAATLDPRLRSLNFYADHLDEVMELLRDIGERPVREYLDRDNVILCPMNTPIMEVIRMLYESPTALPVVLVEQNETRLVGMLSNWDILAKIGSMMFSPDDEELQQACLGPRSKPEDDS
jgi:CBS-domain-containing membrane protein